MMELSLSKLVSLLGEWREVHDDQLVTLICGRVALFTATEQSFSAMPETIRMIAEEREAMLRKDAEKTPDSIVRVLGIVGA